MQIARKNNIDPGFWIGLAMIAFLLFCTTQCK